jgi:hypothetical protein
MPSGSAMHREYLEAFMKVSAIKGDLSLVASLGRAQATQSSIVITLVDIKCQEQRERGFLVVAGKGR